MEIKHNSSQNWKDNMNIKEQISKLRELKDGWYEGDCKGYKQEHLDWLEEKLNLFDLGNIYLYFQQLLII